jgi:hypothetical protein
MCGGQLLAVLLLFPAWEGFVAEGTETEGIKKGRPVKPACLNDGSASFRR